MVTSDWHVLDLLCLFFGLFFFSHFNKFRNGLTQVIFMSGWTVGSDWPSWFASGKKCLSLRGIKEEEEEEGGVKQRENMDSKR